jgi:hypothetical protein
VFQNALAERALFIAIALVGAGLLALRPIPSLQASNDTGRYVYEFKNQCASATGAVSRADLSWETFNFLTRTLCVFNNERAFMFFLALVVPAVFLCFGRWGDLSVTWALAATFSFFGMEFATNALRQSVGLFALVFSIVLVTRRRWLLSLISLPIGIALHISVALYAPFLFYIAISEAIARRGRVGKALTVSLVLMMLIGASWMLGPTLKEFIGTRQLWYQEGSSRFFLAFVHFPILYIYFVRLCCTRGQTTRLENVFFAYVVFISCLTFALFPAILYRLALTNAIIQLYLGSIASNSSNRQAGWVLFGLVLHLMAFFSLSDYARGVIGF